MLHMTVLGNRQPWNPDRFVVVCELCRPDLELGSWPPKRSALAFTIYNPSICFQVMQCIT
jgi:hypothetical protein